jgi:hypothetical protein
MAVAPQPCPNVCLRLQSRTTAVPDTHYCLHMVGRCMLLPLLITICVFHWPGTTAAVARLNAAVRAQQQAQELERLERLQLQQEVTALKFQNITSFLRKAEVGAAILTKATLRHNLVKELAPLDEQLLQRGVTGAAAAFREAHAGYWFLIDFGTARELNQVTLDQPCFHQEPGLPLPCNTFTRDCKQMFCAFGLGATPSGVVHVATV